MPFIRNRDSLASQAVFHRELEDPRIPSRGDRSDSLVGQRREAGWNLVPALNCRQAVSLAAMLDSYVDLVIVNPSTQRSFRDGRKIEPCT